MYYVIPTDSRIDIAAQYGACKTFESLVVAKDYAETQKAKHGINFDIVEVKHVYTTQGLFEVLKPGE